MLRVYNVRGAGLKALCSVVLLTVSCSRASGLDCALLDSTRLNYLLLAKTSLEGQSTELRIEGVRSDIAVVRVRSIEGGIDQLSELRDFAPIRNIDGRAGTISTFALRPMSGSITGFETGADSMYDQTTIVDGKTARVEHVTQRVVSEGVRDVSGCAIPVFRIERDFVDDTTKLKRTAQFEFAPAFGYPLWSRNVSPSPTGPREQITEVTSFEIDPQPTVRAAPPAPASPPAPARAPKRR